MGRVQEKNKRWEVGEIEIGKLYNNFNDSEIKIMEIAKETGSWLNIIPCNQNGTELSKKSFRDSLSLRYVLELKDMPNLCIEI